MGCTQSKIDQDEAISRCKERKLLLSLAVSNRNAFAAAHSSYAVSLKDTGAALSDYAHAEIPLSSTSDSNPASSSGVNLNSVVPNSIPMHPTMESLPPPPPPLPPVVPPAELPPLQRSVSMPDIPLPQPVKKKPLAEVAIREEDEEADDEEEEEEEDEEEEEETLSKSRSHRHHQPLQRSEPIPPVTTTAFPPQPPPPVPVQPQSSKQIEPSIPTSNPPPAMPNPPQGEWDYFFFGSHDATNPPTLSQPEESPWQEPPKHVPIEEEKIEKPPPIPPKVTPQIVEMPVEPPPKPPKQMKKAKPSTASSSGSNSGGGGGSVHHQHTVSAGAVPGSVDSSKKGRMVMALGPTISPSNLLKAIDLLDEYFLKAYESAGDVGKMLEATRMHYHSNFAGSRGHINHSDKIMRVITWNRSFRRLNQQDDMDDKIETDEPESHATILDKLLAWEKKLYEEVKAGEVMKIEYQRKVALLNKQKKRGVRPEVLEKTKAAVSHLHTRYIVDMQSMDSTVSEICHLRDDLLHPMLVELVNGMAGMWRSMHDHHRQQLKIILEIRAPYEIPLPPRETTDEHFRQTNQLHSTAKQLQVQLQKLMNHQKDYVKNLHGWVRLSLIPIESTLKEKVSSPARLPVPPITHLLHAWNDYIGKLPLELANSAILSFSEVVGTILVLQDDERAAKRRCEHTYRELERKRRQFEDWSRKYMERRASLAEEAGTEAGENPPQDPIVERRIQVEQLEIKLKEEQENHRKLCKQVREKSIGSLRTHLPELFRSMVEFSLAASEMYRSLSSVAQSRDEVLD